MFKPIRRLDFLDQLIYRYHYWENYPASHILMALRANHGFDVSASEIEGAFRRIRRVLDTQGRWRLVAARSRATPPRSLNESPPERPGTEAQVAHAAPTVVDELGHREAVSILRDSIEELPELERRALLLRFSRGLTAKECATEMHLQNYKQVYEIQARALSKLRKGLRAKNVSLADFGGGIDLLEMLR